MAFTIGFLLFAVLLVLALLAGLTALATACVVSATFRAWWGRRLRSIAPLSLAAVVLFVLLASWRTTVERQDATVRQTLVQQTLADRRTALADRTAEREAARRSQEGTVQTASPRLVDAGGDGGRGEPLTPPPPPDAVAEPAPVKITLFEGQTETGLPVHEVPEWVQAPEQVDRDRDTERFVLRSSRYAEIDEAEAELLGRLAPRAAEYLARGGIALSPEQITREELRRAAVLTRRLQEQFHVEVGAFNPPVYRVTWEVSLRPSVRESLGAAQRIAERHRRLWNLGGGFGLATLLLGTLAAYFRIDAATQGRYRSRLKAASGVVAAAAAATGLLIA
jgi:membrane protein implicated in regulation of membrane protease activity